jgi:putative oxidoreductase
MIAELASGLIVIGRVLLGGIFVVAGLRHLLILPVLTAALEQRGVAAARAVLLAGTAFQIVAGAALVLGLFVTLASLGLILFTVVASFLLVNFWDKQGEERVALANAFQTNVGLVGGLMLTAALGL